MLQAEERTWSDPASPDERERWYRLDSASRLRWPRRIMVSMTSLRDRLAEAPSPSSPLRSRYSQAIWNESSSSWESETVMSKKPTRTVRVPCHLRFAARFPTLIATGSDRKTTSPNTWASGVSRASQTAKRGFRQSRPDAICRASSSVSPPALSPVAWRFAQASGTRGQATALAKANPCSVLSARNHRPDKWIRPGRSDLDADDEGTAAGDPDTARMGHLGAAGRRGHPRMRRSWLDAGSRRPACARAGLRHRPRRAAARGLV